MSKRNKNTHIHSGKTAIIRKGEKGELVMFFCCVYNFNKNAGAEFYDRIEGNNLQLQESFLLITVGVFGNERA